MVCLVFAFPVLYVLSTGPVAYLRSSGAVDISSDTFDRFYYPIGWAGMKSPAFAQVMRWYLDFWE
jgi:hypothetical protein